MLYDLIPIVGVAGMVIVFTTLIVVAGQSRRAKEETLSKQAVAKLQAELTEIKMSLASIEKMMKDID